MRSLAFALLRRWLGPEARRRLTDRWAGWWMRMAGSGIAPRTATRLAALVVPPYYGRHRLRAFHPKGYTSLAATIHHHTLSRGAHTSLADRVVIYQDAGGGPVAIGPRSTLNHDVRCRPVPSPLACRRGWSAGGRPGRPQPPARR